MTSGSWPILFHWMAYRACRCLNYLTWLLDNGGVSWSFHHANENARDLLKYSEDEAGHISNILSRVMPLEDWKLMMQLYKKKREFKCDGR